MAILRESLGGSPAATIDVNSAAYEERSIDAPSVAVDVYTRRVGSVFQRSLCGSKLSLSHAFSV